jgi:hypothetical protein
MQVLLIMKDNGTRLRVVVSLRKKCIKDKVMLLLGENRRREAFDILKSKAEVESYYSEGEPILPYPSIIIEEDNP